MAQPFDSRGPQPYNVDLSAHEAVTERIDAWGWKGWTALSVVAFLSAQLFVAIWVLSGRHAETKSQLSDLGRRVAALETHDIASAERYHEIIQRLARIEALGDRQGMRQ